MFAELLTTKQAAAHVGVTAHTIRAWIAGIYYSKGKAVAYPDQRKLPAVKVPGGYRIRRIDLERFVGLAPAKA